MFLFDVARFEVETAAQPHSPQTLPRSMSSSGWQLLKVANDSQWLEASAMLCCKKDFLSEESHRSFPHVCRWESLHWRPTKGHVIRKIPLSLQIAPVFYIVTNGNCLWQLQSPDVIGFLDNGCHQSTVSPSLPPSSLNTAAPPPPPPPPKVTPSSLIGDVMRSQPS